MVRRRSLSSAPPMIMSGPLRRACRPRLVPRAGRGRLGQLHDRQASGWDSRRVQQSLGGPAGRRLALMRHAKAEGYDKPDLERALADRGVRDSEAAGQWFAELGLAPDGALVSAAARTRETWAGVAAAADWSVAPTYSEPLYGAGPEAALDLIRSTDAVRVVPGGHRPQPDDGLPRLGARRRHERPVQRDGHGLPDLRRRRLRPRRRVGRPRPGSLHARRLPRRRGADRPALPLRPGARGW